MKKMKIKRCNYKVKPPDSSIRENHTAFLHFFLEGKLWKQIDLDNEIDHLYELARIEETFSGVQLRVNLFYYISQIFKTNRISGRVARKINIEAAKIFERSYYKKSPEK